MQFTTILATLALSLSALADSQSFNLVTLISGNPNIWKDSPLEYASVYVNDTQLFINKSQKPTNASIDDQGHLKLDDDKYVQVKSSGELFEVSESDASTGFSIKDGYLYYNNYEGFEAVPKDDSYVLSTKLVTQKDWPIVVNVQSTTGGDVANFP